MNTSTEIEYPVSELIKLRRSRRAFSDREVEPDKIKSLFEAARWAPSSMNEQPWSYIYATKNQPELYAKIFDSLMEGNQIWVKDAPLLVVSLARRNFIRNEKENQSAIYDMGGANAFLSLQATELGLNVHQMGGYEKDKIMVNLNVPDAYRVGVVMAIGYVGDPAQLPGGLKEREEAPRTRIVQQEFVMNKAF
ncbi:MAG: nitroreductase family protein [Cyclobacteriaceae bacterium]